MAKKIIQYIVATILALAILGLIIINILSSSILSKEYILGKLQNQNYYEKIYQETESNFENYIHQSGLDEDVLKDIVTKEKIEKDTRIILNNIYNGMDEKIDTKEIKEKLTENINNSLNGKISSSEQKAINTFVDTICKEYETTISHTNYEKKINEALNKINKYIDLAKKAMMVIIGVTGVILVLLSIRRIYRITSKIGVAFVIDGLILILSEKYVSSNIKVDTIMLLNNGISDVLQSILNEILGNILKTGSILLALGIVLIIVYALIKSIRKIKREKDQYTPEN